MQNTQHLKWTEEEVNKRLEEHMVKAAKALHKFQQNHSGCSMRTAAFALAIQRVKEATDMRGLG